MSEDRTETGDNIKVELTGGEAIADMLALHEVGPMFGMAGFQLLPFYDAVRRRGLTHTLINDERSGAFMADAWSRVTGRPRAPRLMTVSDLLGRTPARKAISASTSVLLAPESIRSWTG